MRLPPDITSALQGLATDARLRWGYVFGSCLHQPSWRDVDLALMPRADALQSLVEWGQLVAALEAVLHSPVDLVDLRSAPLSLVGPMLEQRVVVVDRERGARHEWEADTTSRWLDFRPALERFSQVRREALAARLRGAS